MLKHKLHTIICGSKNYNKVDYSEVIDSNFDNIVKHNKALPGKPYGHKTTLQIVNGHVWKAIKANFSAAQFAKQYSDIKLSLEYAQKYCDFIYPLYKSNRVKTYPWNNYKLVGQIIKKYLDPKEYKDTFCSDPPVKLMVNGHPQFLHTRCGLGHVAHCIDNSIMPFLVGYELENPDKSTHIYRGYCGGISGHNRPEEVKLMVQLHNKGLIDASLCLLRDNFTLMDKFKPTDIGLELIRQVASK